MSQPHRHWIFWSSQKVVSGETIKFQLIKISGVEEESIIKSARDTPLLNRKEEQKTTQHLVPGNDGKFLNDTLYNCRNTVHLRYNLPEAGCTGTCSLQVTHSLAQKKIHQNYPINYNWLLLDTYSLASVPKMHLWRKISETETQRRNCWCLWTSGIYLSIVWGTLYYCLWNFISMNCPW